MPSLPKATPPTMPPVVRIPFTDGCVPPGDIDPDYLYFLQHLHYEGEHYVFELPAQGQSQGASRHEAPPASSHGECASDPDTAVPSTNRGAEQKESSASVEQEPALHGSAGGAVDEDYRIFLQHIRLVDGQLILEIGDRVVIYDQPGPARSGPSNGEVDKKRVKRRAVEVDPPGGMSGVGRQREGVALRSPATPVPSPHACDWQADQKPVQEDEAPNPKPGQEDEAPNPKPGQEDEAPVHAAAAGRMNKGVNWEASSSNGPGPGLPSVSEGKVKKEPGIIWPAHITERPDSDFKRRLIQVLTEPASRKEYYELFDKVTIRKPLVKLRTFRNDAKFCETNELGSSFLDHYPGLAKQIMETGSGRGLALMRGFFFWLQNNAHEDQFMPWQEELKDPDVIPLVD